MGDRAGQGQCQGQGLGPVGVATQLVSQEDEVPLLGSWSGHAL